MPEMRKIVRADLLVGRIRERDEKEDEMPDMREHECGAANFRCSGEDFEKELRSKQSGHTFEPPMEPWNFRLQIKWAEAR
jgi:hypothetical protein